MLYIAHRGNISGRIEKRENDPVYIQEALGAGYDAEVDVWRMDDHLYLGHDEPTYLVDDLFLADPRLWIHCKNITALGYLSTNLSLNLFFHVDGIVITTQGFLWTAPGYIITHRSIAVMPELVTSWDTSLAYGICTDFPLYYKYGHSLSDNNM